jgi:hypothetical protein
MNIINNNVYSDISLTIEPDLKSARKRKRHNANNARRIKRRIRGESRGELVR